MPYISFNDRRLQCEDGETVLDAMLRQDQAVDYSCKAGVCQSCLLRCTQGEVPAAAQVGLRPNLARQGFFLACQCVPQSDMQVSLPGAALPRVRAALVDRVQLSPSVYRLRLQAESPLHYDAGQFVNLHRDDGLIRSYSLASLPGVDDSLELHVKRMDNGRMSHWLTGALGIGDSVELEGPHGSCIYDPATSDRPVLMIGTGTGLSPLLGVLRDALHNGHRGPIHLYHAARSQDELYMDDELRTLAARHDVLHYTGCVNDETAGESSPRGIAGEVALREHPMLAGWLVYLCGAPVMVRAMQKSSFLAGAAMQDIHVDPFETPQPRQQQRGGTGQGVC